MTRIIARSSATAELLVFAARCYVHKRASYAIVYAVSVSLSETFVYSVETSRHVSKILSPSASHIILVFFQYQSLWQNKLHITFRPGLP